MSGISKPVTRVLWYLLLERITYIYVTCQGCKWANMIGPENMRSVASAASGALAPHGRGSRGPLKGPGGVQGQSPWRGSRGQRPRKLTHFEHFKAILDAFPGSTGALQASTQRGNCFMFTNLFYHKLRNPISNRL